MKGKGREWREGTPRKNPGYGPAFNVSFLENPTEYPHNLILPETRVPAEDLHR